MMGETSPNFNLNDPAKKGDVLLLQRELKEMRDLLSTAMENFRTRQFYTVAEFSALIGIGEAAIQKYCTEGTLKATQIKKGGTWSIYASELERMKKEAVENHFSSLRTPTRRDKAILKKLGFSLKETRE